MQKLIFWVLKHPIISIGLLVIITVGLCWKVNTLEIDSSAEGLMVEGDPARDYYETIKEKFGDDNLTVVVLQADDIFTMPALRVIGNMTEDLESIEGVTSVESLTTVNRIQGVEDTLDTGPLIDEIPEDAAGLKDLRKIAMRNYIYINNVISKDARAAAINIFTRKPEGKDFNKNFSKQVDEIIDKYKGAFEVYQIGTPLTKVTFSSYIEGDQRTLMPYAVLILVGILFFAFRNIVGVIVPLATAGLSIFWTLGFMAWLKFPINVVTAIIPALLIAIGSTEDTHMISEYYIELIKGHAKKDAVKRMIRRLALPILLTSFTTALGFSTLATNKITILRQFGIVASFGLAINFIITIVVVPIILHLVKAPKHLRVKEGGDSKKWGALDSMLQKIGNIDLSRKFAITAITFFLVGLSIIGCFRLQINTDFVSYFKESSFIRKRSKSIHENLAGGLNFYTVVETEKEEGALEPKVLRQIARLERYLNDTGKFDKTISIADHLSVMNREMNAGDKKFQHVPDSKESAAQYLLMMDDEDIEKYLDYERATANIVVRHNITSSSELRRELKKIRAYCRDNMSPDIKVEVTGEGILINNAADAMARGQATSLGLALGAIFIIMSILFLSIKAGFLSLIPNFLPIIFNFGIMGWAGIPLNTGTCMVAAIALGIAVDDTIHFMTRYHREMKESLDQKKAMYNSLLGEGKPIMFTSVALAFGFIVLVLSNFNPTIQFGFLSAIVMLTAYLSDMFVTPTLMASTQLVTLWDMVGLKLRKDITKVSPLFAGLSHSQAKKVVLLGSMPLFHKGDYILKQGEKGREMYVIVTGSAEVSLDSPQGRPGGQKLAVLNSGEMVGEMGMVGEGVRSANVIVLEDSYIMKIDESSLDRIARRFPRIATKLFFNISKVLSSRLAKQNVIQTS